MSLIPIPYKIIILLVIFFSSCGEKTENTTAPEKKVYYPFAPRLDVDFEKGNKEYSGIVLNIWRGWSSGDLNNYKKYFADSVQINFYDEKFSGNAATAVAAIQKRRNKLSALQAHIDYWQPVYLKEKNEHWVLLWIVHEGTLHNKKLDSWSFHQVWKFNTGGKIYGMQEYRGIWEWN
jgi:hypothetical protein